MASSAKPLRLGPLSGVCPHCGLQTTFTESDLHEKAVDSSPAPPTYPRLEQQLVGALPVYFSAQRCQECRGVSLYADGEMYYPRHDLSDDYYLSLPTTMPLELRKSALHAFKQFPAEPAIAAALMRRVLAEMCQHAGMPQDATTTYVSFLKGKFTDSVKRAQLDQFCMTGNECAVPGMFYMKDNDICACVLMGLVADAAKLLFSPAKSPATGHTASH